ncbi:MAG: hypothetical protein PHS88_10715, partial [Candidatus Omnitrophica bacterium]|nr:hypothetical protein [Candidatus Omnitrophota bacterium]
MTAWLPSWYKTEKNFLLFSFWKTFVKDKWSNSQAQQKFPSRKFMRLMNAFSARKIISTLAVSLLIISNSSTVLLANNVKIENPEMAEQDTSNKTVDIAFDLSWENSWYDYYNYDAVWTFCKYSTDSGTTWNHAKMKGNGKDPTGYSYGTAQSGSSFYTLSFIVPNDQMGVFIQPGSQLYSYSGTVDFHTVKIKWDYASAGLSDAQAIAVNTKVKVFGIEMVYIPEGYLYAGDYDYYGGAGVDGEIASGGASGYYPVYIYSESNALQFNSTTNYYYTGYYHTDSGSDDDSSGSTFTVPT